MSPTFVQFCLEPHLWRNFRENIFVSSSGCTRTLYTNRPLMTMRCQNIYLFDSLVNIQGCLYTQQRTLCSVYCVMCMANPYREIMGEFRPDLYILQVYIYTVYCRVGWSVFGEKTATRQFVPNVLRHQFKIITFNSCLFLWRRASENVDWNSIHTTVNSPKIIGNRFLSLAAPRRNVFLKLF